MGKTGLLQYIYMYIYARETYREFGFSSLFEKAGEILQLPLAVLFPLRDPCLRRFILGAMVLEIHSALFRRPLAHDIEPHCKYELSVLNRRDWLKSRIWRDGAVELLNPLARVLAAEDEAARAQITPEAILTSEALKVELAARDSSADQRGGE